MGLFSGGKGLFTQTSQEGLGLFGRYGLDTDITVAGKVGTQTIQTNTNTTVQFTAANLQTNKSTFTATSDTITIVKPGVYLVIGRTAWSANATGSRTLRLISKTGSIYTYMAEPGQNYGTAQEVSTCQHLQAGDTLRLQVRQTSGANRTLSPAYTQFTVMQLTEGLT